MMETAVLDLSTTQKDFITSEMDELETTFCPSCASELITESEVSNGRCSHCSETGEGSSSNAENTSPVDLSIRSSSSSASTTTAKVTSTTTITCDAGQITTPNGSNSGLELPENLLPSLADVAASSSIAYNVLVQRLLLASAVAAQGKAAAGKKFHCSNCAAAFNSKDTLEGHLRSYCRVRPIKLSPPSSAENRTLSTSDNKPESSQNREVNNLSKKFKCEACGVMFRELGTLKTHQQIYCSAEKRRSSPKSFDSAIITSSSSASANGLLKSEQELHSFGSEEPTFASMNALQNLLLDNRRAQKLTSPLGNMALPLRKRRSPNSDSDPDLKPFAKFQCHSCNIKFNEEKNLRGHEKFYCPVRKLVRKHLTTSSSSEENESAEQRSKSLSPKLVHTSTTSPDLPSTSANQFESPDFQFCKLCDSSIIEDLSSHLESFHKISNAQMLDHVFSVCKNTDCPTPQPCRKLKNSAD